MDMDRSRSPPRGNNGAAHSLGAAQSKFIPAPKLPPMGLQHDLQSFTAQAARPKFGGSNASAAAEQSMMQPGMLQSNGMQFGGNSPQRMHSVGMMPGSFMQPQGAGQQSPAQQQQQQQTAAMQQSFAAAQELMQTQGGLQKQQQQPQPQHVQHSLSQQQQQQGWPPHNSLRGGMQQSLPQQGFAQQSFMQQQSLYRGPGMNQHGSQEMGLGAYPGMQPNFGQLGMQQQHGQMDPMGQMGGFRTASTGSNAAQMPMRWVQGMGHAGNYMTQPSGMPQMWGQHSPKAALPTLRHILPGQGQQGQQQAQALGPGGRPLPPPPPPPPAQWPPPPPPEPSHAAAVSSSMGSAKSMADAAVAFGKRLEELKQQNPSVEVPSDVWGWSMQELESYFSTGGASRPSVNMQDGSTKQPKAQKPLAAGRRESTSSLADAVQYEVEEALQIQAKLREGFANETFQEGLRRLQQRYPERKKKGHADGTAFVEAFQALALTVHAKVLPEWGFSPDWHGVQRMTARMVDALKHPKVQKTQEEINVLMGLPRDANFTPQMKGEELFVYRPNRDGPIPGYTRPLAWDDDGDEGHEFLVEDLQTGELRPRGPAALAEDCEYQVLSKPVVIREQPDEKSKMVGRKKVGKRLRVQRIVNGKWLQLHTSELERLGVQEAWVLLDGSGDGNLLGQRLLERVT